MFLVKITTAKYSILCVQEIKLGEAEIVLTGGTESMSQTPYAVRNARWGSALGVDLKVGCNVAHPFSNCLFNRWKILFGPL